MARCTHRKIHWIFCSFYEHRKFPLFCRLPEYAVIPDCSSIFFHSYCTLRIPPVLYLPLADKTTGIVQSIPGRGQAVGILLFCVSFPCIKQFVYGYYPFLAAEWSNRSHHVLPAENRVLQKIPYLQGSFSEKC